MTVSITECLNRPMRLLVSGVAVICVLSGCSLLRPAQPNSYSEALQVCRFKANGNHPKRTPVPATNPRIESCLARAGWAPDGTRLTAAPAEPTR